MMEQTSSDANIACIAGANTPLLPFTLAVEKKNPTTFFVTRLFLFLFYLHFFFFFFSFFFFLKLLLTRNCQPGVSLQGVPCKINGHSSRQIISEKD